MHKEEKSGNCFNLSPVSVHRPGHDADVWSYPSSAQCVSCCFALLTCPSTPSSAPLFFSFCVISKPVIDVVQTPAGEIKLPSVCYFFSILVYFQTSNLADRVAWITEILQYQFQDLVALSCKEGYYLNKKPPKKQHTFLLLVAKPVMRCLLLTINLQST